MTKRQLTFGSLFAGIGGFDLGFERAGMRCEWQVEIDDFCNEVLAKHWPDVKRYRDVRKCGRDNLESVDVICGGFPCQPHSHAGKRKGAADDRDLWPEYRRIVAELRPTWIVGENVPGIRTTILDQVLSDLEGLDYTCQTFDIPAVAFDAAHLRHRVWIVACSEASAKRAGLRQGEQGGERGRRLGDGSSAAVAHANAIRCNGRADNERQAQTERNWHTQASRWPAEPDVGRVAHGVPRRVDRLRALGNAVVPQVAEFIGRLIVEAHND